MNKTISILISLIFILVWNIAPINTAYCEEAKETLAILDLDVKSGVDKDTVFMMTELLRNMVMKSGKYKLLARDKMEVILQEQKFAQSGYCNTTECQLKMGEILAVKYLLAGTVGKLGKTYIISMQLIDVEKGQVVKTQVEKSASEEDFESALDKLAAYFMETTPTITEEKKEGNITITSNPVQADIYINGTLMGKTPNTIENLQAGKYNLVLKKQGYKEAQKSITIETRKTISQNIDLEKIEQKPLTGSLEIKSEPDGAKVVINGVEKGNTPLKLDDMETGTYRITLKKEGYKDKQTETSVKFSKTTTENFTLEKVESGGGNWVLWVVLGAVVVGGAGAAIALTGGKSATQPAGSGGMEWTTSW